MSVQILDGKAVQQHILDKIKNEVEGLNPKPGLAVVLVGEDPASKVYVNNKEKACQKVGFYSEKIVLSAETSKDELLAIIDRLNADPRIHGILCQFPLPSLLRQYEPEVIHRINPVKDVDGFHPMSHFVPCTPKGIIAIMEHYHIKMKGAYAVVLGRSHMVGKPVAQLLLNHDATVTMTHSKTVDVSEFVKQADIVVAAIGRPEFVKGDWIKDGAVVIDVGINRTEAGLVGDVEYATAKDRAGFITPVPGGIGPMTIAMLMENVLEAYRIQTNQ